MGLKTCLSCCACLVAVPAVLLGYLVQDLLPILGEKQIDFNDAGCELVGAELLKGGEDLALWRHGVALTAAGDLKVTFSQGADRATLTGIFALSLADFAAGRGAGLRQLELVGFPEGPKLAGHGVFLSNRTQQLYVINHGDHVDNVTQVEIFSIEGKGLADLRLRHVGRIRSPLFPLHCLNDVVEGRSSDEVFVSIWRTNVGPEEYKYEDLDNQKQILAYRYVSKKLGQLGVMRCARASGGDWSCARTAAWGMPMANGLAISPDRSSLLVSCPTCFEVWQFAIGWNGSLKESGPRIQLPYPADNLEWDEETGRIFLGMIPIVTRQYPVQSPMELMALPTAELHRSPPPRPVSLLRHSGSKLSQCSAALQYGEVSILSSPYHPGLLLCRPASAASGSGA